MCDIKRKFIFLCIVFFSLLLRLTQCHHPPSPVTRRRRYLFDFFPAFRLSVQLCHCAPWLCLFISISMYKCFIYSHFLVVLPVSVLRFFYSLCLSLSPCFRLSRLLAHASRIGSFNAIINVNCRFALFS